MASTGLFNLPDHWIVLFPRSVRFDWRHAMLAGLVASMFLVQSPVHADEFDVLAVYSDARPLNDQWQVCAASFVRHRLGSSETPEMLAKAAFDQCLAAEHGLTRFLIAKIGRESAEVVMTALRDKYLSGLGRGNQRASLPQLNVGTTHKYLCDSHEPPSVMSATIRVCSKLNGPRLSEAHGHLPSDPRRHLEKEESVLYL